MNLKAIQNLIKFVAKTGVQEVKLEMKDVKLTIKSGSDKVIRHQQIEFSEPNNLTDTKNDNVVKSEKVKKENVDSTLEDKFITIKSPIIGTFYRKSDPEKAPFVNVGDVIKEGDVLCIIEAMKLFNEIESEVSGKIIKILVDDANPVEFDEPLFIVDPS
ncbi:MAG: acetyl-CoA carboxylase, biotin carboxyl carrier protein [Flavobacteriaceae bacterium]|nr:acetyl-CoA carboxylase, biotin carboxyl carrier protein [Flavobacteriaceae bacterium]